MNRAEAADKILSSIRKKAANHQAQSKQRKPKSARARDRHGRFTGGRFDVEHHAIVRLIPAWP